MNTSTAIIPAGNTSVELAHYQSAAQNPARVYLAIWIQTFQDLGPIVLDSSMFVRAGNNPFATGALQLPGALDEMMSVAAPMSLLK